MKTLRNLVMLTAVLTLAACSNENEVIDGPVAAKVTAGIDGPKTRASVTSWDAGDRIGISTTSTGKTHYVNVLYTVKNASNGNFESQAPIYFQDLEEVTFSAYYPYAEAGGTISKTITAADQEAEAQKDIDYMFANGATASKESPVANFTYPDGGTDARFKHCMSLVTFNFQKGADTDLKNMTDFTVSGLKMEGTFDTTNGTAAATDGNAVDLKITGVQAESDTYTRSLIFFPQDATSGFTLKLTLDGVNYQADLTIPNNGTALGTGMNYTYNVTVNKTELTVGQATIAPWNDGGKQDGNAEMQ